jgi:hypothetical protein
VIKARDKLVVEYNDLFLVSFSFSFLCCARKTSFFGGEKFIGQNNCKTSHFFREYFLKVKKNHPQTEIKKSKRVRDIVGWG